MKITSPHSLGRAMALAAASLGLISTSLGASYTLELFSEANPGKYTFAPDTDLSAALGGYAPVATSSQGSNTTYWTFCLEASEYFQSGRTYNAESGLDSIQGGSETGTGDGISVGTAYLYQQFVLGKMTDLVPDFVYDALGGARMQRMIWHLEGEAGGVVDADLLGLISGFSDIYADYEGTDVGVLVLTKFNGKTGDTLLHSQYGTRRQDQLVYWGPKQGDSPPPSPPPSSVPDSGTTLLLFVLSLAGVGFASRKQKA